jgi:hypothetical protein
MADAARAAGRQLTRCNGRRRTRRRGPPHRITRPPVRHAATRPALTGGIRRRAHCRKRHNRKPSSPHRARDERDNPQQHQPGRDTRNATERARPPTVRGDEHRALARVRCRLQSGVALALADQLSRLQCHLRRSHLHTPFNTYEPPRSEGRQDRDAVTRRSAPSRRVTRQRRRPQPLALRQQVQLRAAAVRPDRARRRSRWRPGPIRPRPRLPLSRTTRAGPCPPPAPQRPPGTTRKSGRCQCCLSTRPLKNPATAEIPTSKMPR